MSWRRSRGSFVLRDTSGGKYGYQRDIRSLTRSSSFGRSFRGDRQKYEVLTDEEPKEKLSYQAWIIYRKLRKNKTYRIRVLYSLCLVWVYMILGWTSGQLGPILLDLALITDVSLEVSSTYILIIGLGYIVGSFLGGMVYERMSRPLSLFIASLILAVFEISIPYCKMYWIMMIVLLLDGICEGFIDTVANTEMVSIWGKAVESWMQGMYFMFAVGAVISPLVTAPFLAPELTTVVQTQVETSHSLSLYRYDVSQSRINLVYIINACLALVAAIFFFLQCWKNSRYLHGLSLPISDSHQLRPLSTKDKCLVLLLMGFLCLLYTSVEETFAEYLTTFCVSQLSMTKVQGSEATSVFYAAFGVARFIGIFVVTQINPVSLVCVYSAILILSLCGLALSGAFLHTIGIWFFSPFVGVGLSIIYPILYTWTDEQFVPITGKIAAWLVIMASIGGMINPVILGHLIDNQSPMWFCYLLLGESLLFFILYVVGLILARWISSKSNVQRLCNSEVELDMIKTNFGLDKRYDPSIGSFDRKSPPPFDDKTGLHANIRLSATIPSKPGRQASAEKQKMHTISEDNDGTQETNTSSGKDMESNIVTTTADVTSSDKGAMENTEMSPGENMPLSDGSSRKSISSTKSPEKNESTDMEKTPEQTETSQNIVMSDKDHMSEQKEVSDQQLKSENDTLPSSESIATQSKDDITENSTETSQHIANDNQQLTTANLNDPHPPV